MQAQIVLLPGDGVGPEVVAEAQKVLEADRQQRFGHGFSFETHLMGGCAIGADGRAAARGDARGLQAVRRRPARRRRRPKVGRPEGEDSPREGACSPSDKGSASTRTCAR